jgi:hypothetical protein
LSDEWTRITESEYAKHILDQLGWDQIGPEQDMAELCPDERNCVCGFEQVPMRTLISNALKCDVCRLALNVGCQRIDSPFHESMVLQRKNEIIGVVGGLDVLSIYPRRGSNSKSRLPIGLATLPDVGSPQQFALLKTMMQQCDTTHQACQPLETQLAPPTRLISLDDPVHLIVTSQNESYKYTALSHCWGVLSESERFCTSKDNLATLQQSIGFHLLPRTFQDAILVTRAVGLKYLWIDSLCIIQDDAADWEAEAARMGDVFSAAWCTIAASAAKSSTEGFLHPRPARPCLTIPGAEGEGLYACPAIDDFHRHVEQSTLNSRGWVLQERVLSRRSIYFTTDQVYWECSEGIFSETLSHIRK